ncbi:MAG: hypothetical protein KAU06_02525 [Candidatus Marinimicrobia bacterium]|nr:hypothetical protein [Candidatus Neomarinimicrobiota bacterium]
MFFDMAVLSQVSVPDTNLCTKQLHFIYKFNNVIPTWYIFELGVEKYCTAVKFRETGMGTDGAKPLENRAMLVAGCWILDTGCWILDAVYRPEIG